MGLDIGKAMGSNIELSVGCIQGLRYRGILLEQPAGVTLKRQIGKETVCSCATNQCIPVVLLGFS